MSTPSAEPKGPPPLDDGAGAKKASKKSSSKRAVDGGPPVLTPSPAVSQLSTAAATPTSPVLSAHDVPRLAIADPKGPSGVGDGAGGDGSGGKVRAAKKRTSTPENQPPAAAGGPSLPSASDGPPAAAKSDADVEKERAKREAKKQRARDLEEQRKRDELERLAVEEARRKEEQRQRELRRQQEQAQLNANADVVQDEEDDGYGDDFEDYGDDFENDDATPATARAKAPASSTPAKPLAKAKGVPREPDAPTLDSNALKRIQEAQKAESKELASTSRPSSKSSSKGTAGVTDSKPQEKSEAKKHNSPATSIAASIAGLKQSLDPRAKRAKEIRDSRRFDVEKFNVLVQAPMAEVDIYLARLRRGNVRQVAIQTKDDDKSVATQTKVPELVDRSMHFPDDVGIDDVAKRVKSRSKRPASSGDNQAENDSGNPEEDDEDDDTLTVSSMRFLSFLEQSSQVCEQLIEENIQEHEAQQASDDNRSAQAMQLSRNSTLSRSQLFPSKKFDQSGLERLLQGRSLTALQFSPAVSNILVSWHSASAAPSEAPAEEKQQTDEPPAAPLWNQSIACVWDINQLSQALYVLKSEDCVTTCSLSPTRELIVVAGTQDGSVNAWDLRSRLGLAGRCHSPQHDLDLYSPTFSTCGADSRSIEGTHQSPIVAIDIVEHQDGQLHTSGVFQFASLDDRGVLLVWSMVDYSNSRGADTLLSNKCVAIGGHIKFVVSVAIDTQLQYLALTRPVLRTMLRRDPNCLADLANTRTGREPADSSSRRASFGNTSRKKNAEDAFAAELNVGPIATVVKFFAHDPNHFLVGTTTGIVLRGNRFQQTPAHASQHSSESSASHPVECYRRERQGTIAAPVPVGVAVTSIAFHPFESDYFLVGYEDGRICLFDDRQTAAVSTWEDVDYDKSVTTLQWSPSRPGVFFASYSHGLVQAWDLTTQRHAPAFEHKVSPRKGVVADAYPIALSSERMRTSRPSIAVCCGDEEPFGFQVHELGAEFTTRARDEERAVQHILATMF